MRSGKRGHEYHNSVSHRRHAMGSSASTRGGAWRKFLAEALKASASFYDAEQPANDDAISSPRPHFPFVRRILRV
jgi:hypothetical protein